MAGSLCEDVNNDPSTLGSGVSAGVPYEFEGDFAMIRTDITILVPCDVSRQLCLLYSCP